MKGKLLIEALDRQFGPGLSQARLASILGMKQPQVSAAKKKNATPLVIARLIKRLHDRQLDAVDLLEELKSRLGVANNSQLADSIGLTPAALSIWKGKPLTAKRVANAILASMKQAQLDSFRPLVEMFPIRPVKKKTKYEVFDDSDGRHKLRSGLKQELETSKGIYVFYDVRGAALYVGKAKDQSLWKELNAAYNRARGAQSIMLVNHPSRNVKYSAAHEKLRQPVDTPRKLVELAAFFSAYQVNPVAVDNFEALLIRAFPNDLLNSRLEKVKRKSAKAKKAKSKRPKAKRQRVKRQGASRKAR